MANINFTPLPKTPNPTPTSGPAINFTPTNNTTPNNTPFPTSDPTHTSFLQKVASVGSALTSSEQGFGQDLSMIGSKIPQEQADQTAKNSQNVASLLKIYHSSTDPVQKLHLANALKAMGTDVTAGDINPAFNKTPGQVIGDAAGTALDVASAGSYGKEASLAENSGKLVTKSEALAGLLDKAGISSVVTPTAENVTKSLVKPALSETLQTIGKKTAVKAAEGAGLGYSYDVARNLQDGATGKGIFKPGAGTWTGAALPAAIGTFEAGTAITKEYAPRIINSLVKPSIANFSYGRDPGRTISELGITGNSLKGFGENVSAAKEDVGHQIGDIISNPANADETINAQSQIDKIDQSISDAAKGGKNNQSIVTTLTNIKNALLYDHGVNADGDITRLSATPRDLTAMNPEDAFKLKQDVASMTRFTGNASDDKAVNATLKSIYGGLKDSINEAVGKNNPEITKLNQQYADLTSAELAIQHRSDIMSRANLVSLPNVIEGGTALVAALSQGGANIHGLVAAAGTVALEKALSSTAVKTRIAAWLGSESPEIIQALSPSIKETLSRALPKFAAQLSSKKK